MSEQYKQTLDSILNMLQQNKAVLAELKADNNQVKEVVFTVHQHVEDMSKKFDDVLNFGFSKPKAPPVKKRAPKIASKKVVPEVVTTVLAPVKKRAPKTKKVKGAPPVKNIMTYFKSNFIDEVGFFDEVLEESQVASQYAEHKEALSAKKEGAARNRTKATLIYKSLTLDQKKKIRELMDDEIERASLNTSDEIAPEETEA
jgi:hypothetical protein